LTVETRGTEPDTPKPDTPKKELEEKARVARAERARLSPNFWVGFGTSGLDR